VKFGELCELDDLVNYMNLWLVNYVTWWIYLITIILVIVMMCESYIFELVIFFGNDDFLAYTFEMMSCKLSW